MGMLDGKYWIVYGDELLGVTEDESKIEKALQDAFLEDFRWPEQARVRLGVRLKFEQYRLTSDGIEVVGYYAENAKAL